MDNFDLKNYISNNPLLNEIKINPPLSFSNQDIDAVNILTDGFGEGVSSPKRDYPLEETYSLDDYEYDEEAGEDDYENKKSLAIKHLLTKPAQSYLIKDIFGLEDAPGAPEDAHYIRVAINKEDQSVSVESPYLDEDGEYYMGWFGRDKKYYPDTDHFTEDGEYIGGAE